MPALFFVAVAVSVPLCAQLESKENRYLAAIAALAIVYAVAIQLPTALLSNTALRNQAADAAGAIIDSLRASVAAAAAPPHDGSAGLVPQLQAFEMQRWVQLVQSIMDSINAAMNQATLDLILR